MTDLRFSFSGMPAALFSYFSGFDISLFYQLKQASGRWGGLGRGGSMQFPQGRGAVSLALARGATPANRLFWSDGQAALLVYRLLSSAGGADTHDSHQGSLFPVPLLQAAHPHPPHPPCPCMQHDMIRTNG